MVEVKFKLLVLFGLLFNLTSSEFAALVGPRIVPFGKEIKFFLTAVDFLENDVANFTLKGHSDSEEYKTSAVLNGQQEISLKLPGKPQNYTLTMIIAKVNFNQSVDIFTIPKRYSVLIQTDKAMYKPGDKVKFRVLVLNNEAKLYDVKREITVQIMNPLSEQVREIKKTKDQLESKFGVLVEEFSIAENTNFGNWILRAVVDGETDMAQEMKFEVKEYVLHRFKVMIETKPFVRPNEETLHLNVSGFYTFGKFVKGKATVVARIYDSHYKHVVQHQITKTANVDIFTDFTFDIKNDLKINNAIRPYEAEFEVTFEEILTTQHITKRASVRIHSTEEFYLHLTKEKTFFRPGFPFKLRAIVTDVDGKLQKDHFRPVIFKVTLIYKKPKCTESARKYSDAAFEDKTDVVIVNGFADLIIEEVPLNTTKIRVEAQFLETKTSMIIKKFMSNTQEYIEIKKPTSKLTIGATEFFEVKGNQELHELYIVVIGRSGIVYIKTQEVEGDDLTKFSFPLVLTKEMAPISHLLVYYIQTTGEIIHDFIKLNMEIPLENKLQVLVTPKETLPRQNTKFQISSRPLSHVFLLAVDKSVKILKGGNDIDADRIIADTLPHTNKHNFPGLKSYKNRYLDVEEANTFILTNAIGGTEHCLHLEPDTDYIEDAEIDVDPALSELTYEHNEPDIEFDENFDRVTQSKIRKNSAGTWLFYDFEMNEKGKRAFSLAAPDTIAAFVVTGFSVHKDFGLAVAEPLAIKVFKEFFINLHLPYSIRLGEVLKVDVTVFNHIASSKNHINAQVTLNNTKGEFEFVELTPSGRICDVRPLSDHQQIKSVTVDPQSGASTFFLIRAKITGNLTLSLKAQSGDNSDEIKTKMLVEHEGFTETRNFPHLFDLRKKTNQNRRVNLPIPETAIENSIYIEASTVGDLLGLALANINNLVQMPGGCTEQVFKSWIPNIAVYNYLKSIGRATNEREETVKSYLSHFYQQILKQQRGDGSFSFCGESGAASVWLTAYIVKLLKHAKKFISIDDKRINLAVNFIKTQQNADGSFADSVHGYNYISETGSQRGIPMTAFITIALLEDGLNRDDDKALVEKSLSYIDVSAIKVKSNLVLAMSAYAFALNKHNSTESCLKNLLHNAIVREDEMFWNREVDTTGTEKSTPITVEIAAYAIMAFVTAGRAVHAVPIVKWLVKQQNSAGGFHSTTDTVLAIQALSMIGSEFYTPNVAMEIKLEYERGRQHTFTIDSASSIEPKYIELERDTKNVAYAANGTGLALFQISIRYNTNLVKPLRQFELTVERLETSTESLLNLKVCTKFIQAATKMQSGTALIEVNLPSGFEYDSATANKVRAVGVRKTETLNQKSIIVLYFDSIGTTQVCPEIVAVRKTIVAELKKSVVKVYDYYSPDERATAFYSIKAGKVCEV